MLRWILVAIIAVLLSVTVFMFIQRFADDEPTPPSVAEAPTPAAAPSAAPAPAESRSPTPPAPAPAPAPPAPVEERAAKQAETAAKPVEPPSAPREEVRKRQDQAQPAPPPAAQAIQQAEFSLARPVACTLGRDCFIQQYTDTDPGPDARDFTCGPLSYQSHKGTDFRVANLKAMHDGVAVIAARDGVVRATRDGMEDVNVKTLPAGAVAGRECGNAVVLTHEPGWETQYCHLQQGSVAVRKGQVVRAGEQLALIGMSGQAEFPHLHLGVRKDGKVVDPFRGLNPATACGGSYDGLWNETARQQVVYQPGGILDAGMVDRQLTSDQAGSGTFSPAALDRNGQALIAWYIVFGIRQGDVLSISITGPNGNRVFDQTLNPHPKDQAQYFAFGGRRTPPDGFQPGTYRTEIRMRRDGTLLDRRELAVPLR